MYKFTESITWT